MRALTNKYVQINLEPIKYIHIYRDVNVQVIHIGVIININCCVSLVECLIYDTNCNETNFNSSFSENELKNEYNITLWDDINNLKDEYPSKDEFVCVSTTDQPSSGDPAIARLKYLSRIILLFVVFLIQL
jgi:hypothetical protein